MSQQNSRRQQKIDGWGTAVSQFSYWTSHSGAPSDSTLTHPEHFPCQGGGGGGLSSLLGSFTWGEVNVIFMWGNCWLAAYTSFNESVSPSHPEAPWLPPQEGGSHVVHLGGGLRRCGRGMHGSGRDLCAGRRPKRDGGFILRNDLSDNHHSTDFCDGRHGRGQRSQELRGNSGKIKKIITVWLIDEPPPRSPSAHHAAWPISEYTEYSWCVQVFITVMLQLVKVDHFNDFIHSWLVSPLTIYQNLSLQRNKAVE